ncbi:MAG TPA: aldehyde dehydrogenase family protein [Rectinemataceae bacterium]|nr:aldehyde dehydrogenase family protein [Rectinemataceae bacterium]
MGTKDFPALLEAQRSYFKSGALSTYDARRRALLALSAALHDNEEAILEALRLDLHKSRFEAYSNEVATLNAEIAHSLSHLRAWMRPRRVWPELHLLPSRGEIRAQALGCSLIIAPWNYPIQLALAPLVAALAAGCTALIKPSELSTHAEALIVKIIGETFDPALVAVVTGGPEVTTELLRLPFDKFFFTGSPAVGKIVMRAAAEHLASVTLELGGKSPALVDSTVDLVAAARMIAWGKFNNAGQTCVAPDYVLVEESVKGPFIEALRKVLQDFFGADPKASPDFGRIVNRRHFDRIQAYLGQGRVAAGGDSDPGELYIAPTILERADWDAPVMTDEIFGPVLPVLGYSDPAAAVELVAARPRPLSLYIFSNDKKTRALWRDSIPYGGGGIHSTVLQFASSRLPFGGIGASGLGSYHGKAGFDAFTHYKSILVRSPRLEPGLFYPPKMMPLALVRIITGGARRPKRR